MPGNSQPFPCNSVAYSFCPRVHFRFPSSSSPSSTNNRATGQRGQRGQRGPGPQLHPPARRCSSNQLRSPPRSATQRNYLEDAFTLTPLRDSLAIPYPSPTPASWEDRLFLDSRDEWTLGNGVTVTYSGRFNLRAANDVAFPSHESVRNDLREAYVSWHPDDSTFIDLGRVNVKSGVAAGFNPTDFFRTRAVVEPLTADPDRSCAKTGSAP